MKKIRIIFWKMQFGWLLSCISCTYQFTNDSVVTPGYYRTIAVEAVYDTSREVLRHEYLWESIQLALASDGRLTLSGHKESDLLLRAHLKSAQVTAGGSELLTNTKKDPEPYNQDLPPTPEKFADLTISGRYRDSGVVAFTIDVEVYNLRSQKLVFKQTYSGSDVFRAVHQTGNRQFTVPENDFLRYEEAIQARFKEISRTLSRSMVRDLVVALASTDEF